MSAEDQADRQNRYVRALAADWADPTSPRVSRRHCPDDDLDCLAGLGRTDEIMGVLLNPVVSAGVKTALATRLSGYHRTRLWSNLLDHRAPVGVWVAISPALTPTMVCSALLALTDRHLLSSAGDRRNYWSVRAGIADPLQWRAELLRGLATARAPKARALVAEAAPLWTGKRHSYATGRLSAPALAADTDIGVRVGVARNPHFRDLPDDPAGIATRKTLLADPAPRVRTAARRNGLHVTQTDTYALMAAFYQRSPHIFGLSTDTADIQAELETGPPDQPLPLAWSGLVTHDPLDDPDPRVRVTAIRSGIPSHADHLWERVLNDPSHLVRGAAATHGFMTPPHAWQRLVSDPDRRVRRNVARSRWAPPLLLRRLTGDTDPEIQATAQHRVAPRSAPH